MPKPKLPTPDPAHAEAFAALRAAFLPFMEQKPYLHVYDSTLLAVEAPGTQDVYYAYIMGELGEVVGFNVLTSAHIGPWIAELNEAVYEGFAPGVETIQAIPMWQVCYAPAGEMEPLSKALNLAAGVVFKKGVRRAGIEARDLRPGYMPKPAGTKDLQTLAAIIPGLAHLVAHFAATTDREEADDLTRGGRCLLARQSANGDWSHEERALPPATHLNPYAAGEPDPALVASLRGKKKSKGNVLIEAVTLPGGVKEGEGYVLNRMLAASDMKTGLILGFQLVPIPEWATKAQAGLGQLLKDMPALPQTIVINDHQMGELLVAWCHSLDMDLQVAPDMPGFAGAIADMMGGRQGF